MHRTGQPKPKHFDKEPKNLIIFVHTHRLVKMIALDASLAADAVFLALFLKHQAVGTDIGKRRKVWSLQKGHKVWSIWSDLGRKD